MAHPESRSKVTPCRLPPQALLGRYAQSGAYTDCYTVDVRQRVEFPSYVFAFYSSSVFKVERFLLGLFARRPATDTDAKALAEARIGEFAIWRVEDRNDNQLLLRDQYGRTRSWLMTAPGDEGSDGVTRLYFGSAVVARSTDTRSEPSMGFWFHALSGFHHIYSRALLRSARSRLTAL